MRRARLNLLVDAVIGVAFLITAATGVVFLLPPAWQQALLAGLTFHTWHWLHDWSGAVAAVGVAAHLALHWRWVVHTAGRWLADARGGAPRRRSAATTRAPSAQAGVAKTAQPRGRLTRRGFLVGAAGFGAAVLGGVALSRIAGAAGTGRTTAGASTGRAGAAGAAPSSGGTAGSSSNGTAGASSNGTSSGATSSSGGATSTATTRVVVDSSSCIACGHCLQVCPKDVFAWNGAGRATAQSPDGCILCRRCVQVCPPSAITLNA